MFRSCCWGFFRVWCGSFGVLSLILYQSANLHFLLCCLCCFCCLLAPVCSVVFFLLLPSVTIRVQICPPVISCVPPHTISAPPLYHITPIRPKQPMCDHLRPPWARACGYDRVRGCLCFCVFVACTVCVRILVFGLAGESVYVLCVCLCVFGCPVCSSLCMNMYFAFLCVCLHVCIFVKIGVYR